MSRRVNIPSNPPITLLAISERGGVWEERYRPLEGSFIGDLFSHTDRRAIDDAIRGHEAPLRKSLGISPQGALRKLPSRECAKRLSCTFYDQRKCKILSSKMPWCFMPEGLGVTGIDDLVTEVIAEWKKGTFVVIVRENV